MKTACVAIVVCLVSARAGFSAAAVVAGQAACGTAFHRLTAAFGRGSAAPALPSIVLPRPPLTAALLCRRRSQNVGVDPPDVVKTAPCARLECWIDPLATNAQHALDQISRQVSAHDDRSPWRGCGLSPQTVAPLTSGVFALVWSAPAPVQSMQ